MEIRNIVMIGAGNVATHLGRALVKSGFRVCQVYSRTPESASVLAGELNCGYTVSLQEIVADADLYIVSVKDAVLEDILPRVAASSTQALFVHTAGSVPMRVWEGLASRYGVLYPMQTFSRMRNVDFSQVSFFVEAASRTDMLLLKELAVRLGGRAYEATSAQRQYLHLAAVFACNFSNHMYAVAHRLLERNGLPFEALFPLIDETVRKVHELPPAEAQTGPARRADGNVMARHLQLLGGEPRLAGIYEEVSRSIAEYAAEENTDII